MKRFWLVLFVLFLIGCTNTNPPSYIKDVTTYKEGSDGLVVYFTLADSNGAQTAFGGNVTLTITQTDTDFSSGEMVENETTLYETNFPVTTNDFRKAKLGMGAFEHEALICNLGRMAYSSFAQQPRGNMASGKAKLTFTAEGCQTLSGESTIIF